MTTTTTTTTTSTTTTTTPPKPFELTVSVGSDNKVACGKKGGHVRGRGTDTVLWQSTELPFKIKFSPLQLEDPSTEAASTSSQTATGGGGDMSTDPDQSTTTFGDTTPNDAGTDASFDIETVFWPFEGKPPTGGTTEPAYKLQGVMKDEIATYKYEVMIEGAKSLDPIIIVDRR
jgi:hypothetical protein